MKTTGRWMILSVAMFAAVAASSFAYGSDNRSGGGGGGTFVSREVPSYLVVNNSTLQSANTGLSTVGGFGYRVNSRNEISGGFGYAIVDDDRSRGIAGGMAGFIGGYRFIRWPLNVSLVSWTGFGGMYTGNVSTNPHQGFFCVREEIDLEVGLPVLGWFMPTLFAGYQVTGNIAPGRLFQDFLTYSPVIGFRLVWGSFR